MLHSVLGRFYFIAVKAPLKELYQHILGMARITLCEENLTSHVGKIKSHSVAKRHLGMLKLRCGAFHATVFVLLQGLGSIFC